MDFKDCINFANENRVSYVSTCDGDQPRVRAFLMWLSDESGFLFPHRLNQRRVPTAQGQPESRGVHLHPEVRQDDTSGRRGGVPGRSPALRLRLLEERPFLKALVKGPDDPLLTIFRIPHGEAYFWTMADNMREAEVPRIKF